MKNIIKLFVSQLLKLWVMLLFIHHNPLMLWATGIKSNNAISYESQTSWEDLFQIDGGGLTNATRANFHVEVKGDDRYRWVECLYMGTGALTNSEFNNFPIGSTIRQPKITTPVLLLKTGATTWKYQAINT